MQQLSLPLEILNSKSNHKDWFKKLLATLKINPEKTGPINLVNLYVNI